MGISNQRIRVDLEQGTISESLLGALKLLQQGHSTLHLDVTGGAENVENALAALHGLQQHHKIDIAVDGSRATEQLARFEKDVAASVARMQKSLELKPQLNSNSALPGIEKQAEAVKRLYKGTSDDIDQIIRNSNKSIEAAAKQLAKSKVDLTSPLNSNNQGTNFFFDLARQRAQQIKNTPEFQVAQFARTKNRLDSLATKFDEEVSVKEMFAGLFGGEDKRRSIRLDRVRDVVQENQNVFGLEEVLSKKAQLGSLPPIFNLKNLTKAGVPAQLGLSAIAGAEAAGLGGAVTSLVAGGVGGAVGGLPGALAATALTAVLGSVSESMDKAAERMREAGEDYARAVLSVSASINEASQVLKNGAPASISETFKAQNRFANQVVQQGRATLGPLGIGGEQADNLTRVVQSSLTNRLGHVPSIELINETVRGFGAAFQVVDQPGLSSGRAINVDVADILGGSQRGRQTQLGQRLPEQVLADIARATSSGDEQRILKSIEPLAKFAETLEKSDNPATVIARLSGAQQNLFSAGGQALTEAALPGQQRLLRAEQNPDVKRASEQFGKFAGGASEFVNTSLATGIELGSAAVNLIGDLTDAVRDPIPKIPSLKLPGQPGSDGFEFVQSPQQSLQSSLKKFGLLDTVTSFNDVSKLGPEGLSAVLDKNINLSRQLGGIELPALLAEKQRNIGELTRNQLAGISTNTFAGRSEAIDVQRVGLQQQVGAGQELISALREQLPKLLGDDLLSAQDKIKGAENEILALKRQEADLARQQYENLVSAAEKTAQALRFASSAAGLEAGRAGNIAKLQEAIHTGKSPEDRISARLALNELQVASPESIRLQRQIDTISPLSIAGRAQIAQLQAQKADVDIDALTAKAPSQRNVVPGSEEFVANAISIEDFQARAGKAGIEKEKARDFFLDKAPLERATTTADLNLALRESANILKDETLKRRELTNSLTSATNALNQFDLKAKNASLGKEGELLGIVDQLKAKGINAPAALDLSDSQRQTFELDALKSRGNELAANLGLGKQVFGFTGTGLNLPGESTSPFAQSLSAEKDTLGKSVHDVSTELDSLATVFTKTRASLEQRILTDKKELGIVSTTQGTENGVEAEGAGNEVKVRGYRTPEESIHSAASSIEGAGTRAFGALQNAADAIRQNLVPPTAAQAIVAPVTTAAPQLKNVEQQVQSFKAQPESEYELPGKPLLSPHGFISPREGDFLIDGLQADRIVSPTPASIEEQKRRVIAQQFSDASENSGSTLSSPASGAAIGNPQQIRSAEAKAAAFANDRSDKDTNPSTAAVQELTQALKAVKMDPTQLVDAMRQLVHELK